MSLRIMRKQDQAVLITEGKIANSFTSRLIGLMGKKTFLVGEALLFPRCNSVHMWMMRFPIDVVFLKTLQKDKEWEIVKTFSDAQPWRILPISCFNANDTLELPEGTISKFNLKSGEVLCTV